MFTVCPKCALTLVVTAADLRVAQGYVRCGRCSSVFNALARLADERQAAGVAAEGALPSELPAASVAEESEVAAEPEAEAAPAAEELSAEAPVSAAAPDEEAIPDDALEFDPASTDVTSVFVEQAPDPNWTAATGSFKSMVAANQESASAAPQVEVEIDSAFLASMLKGETPEPAATAPRAAAASPPAPAPAPQSAAPAARAAAPSPPTPPAQASTASARARPTRPVHGARHARPPLEAAARAAPPPPPPAPAPEEPAPAPADDTESVPRLDWSARLQGLAWPAAVAGAVLVLLAQIINHYRDELAGSARFNRPLTALYGALGVHLAPHWDLRAYDVRQLGADVDPAGTITVRASIKNAAHQAQPLPLLRVTLQDRFGNRIASSDVAPRHYLPRTIPDSSFLSAGQRIDAQMGFLDPGANAVGFELDACLPGSSGAVSCANDAATR